MFKHLLVPTDGSELSFAAVRKAVSFAKECSAQISFIFVQSNPEMATLEGAALLRSIDTDGRLTAAMECHGQEILDNVRTLADADGVRCETLYKLCSEPYESIIEAADSEKCDIIVMASHGYRGVKGLLLGSQTQKVLTHCRLPVLVYR